MNTEPRLETRMSKLEHRQTMLEAQVQELSDGMMSSFRQIGDLFDTHGGRIEKIDRRVEKIDHRIEKIEGRLDRIEENMATKDDIAAVRQEMATKDDLSGIRQEMATKDDLSGIRQDMAAMNNKTIDMFNQMMTLINAKL